MADLLTCQRCGQDLHPLADLSALARQLSARAAEARRSLDGMRLALPAIVPAALTEARLDAAILARRLDCHAGTCTAAGAR